MLTKDFFKGKRVTVFGLGLSSGGVGTVEFLVKRGVKEVVVTDIKTKEDLQTSIAQLSAHKNIRFVLGQHRPEDFSRTDLVIKNPLIPWSNEYVKIAEQNNVPVEMDSSIFMALVPPVPVFGVTGTKGKTTTATLLAHILETSGKKVVRVGIGQGTVLGTLDNVTKDSVVVFEISSWRCSALHRLKKSPTLSIVTNLYPDHLNYYKTMAAYANDKEAIFAYQRKKDHTIFNADNAETLAMSDRAPGQKMFFSETDTGRDGAFIRDERIVFRTDGGEAVGFPYQEVKLIGRHNRGNVLAATLAARLFGLETESIRSGVASFPGVDHRLEFSGEVNGVRYVNDSAATIPTATIAALSACDQPVVLLAGGSDKKLPLEDLVGAIAERVRETILFKGTLTDRLLPLLTGRLPDKTFMVVDTMEGAVRAASRLARPGETVLLSPGAASFGLFQNEFDRGTQFKVAVSQLARGR